MKPLVDKRFTIQKKATKGGWHFVLIRGIPIQHRNKQGLIRVRGTVDSYELKQFNLLPVKTGEMMLVLNAQLRKAISKKEGERVHVKLFLDASKVKIPEDIRDSLLQSVEAWQFFETLTESNKKYYIDWVQEAKSVDTKVTRIVKMIRQLEHRKKFWDWPAIR
jgi:hypothetical protein